MLGIEDRIKSEELTKAKKGQNPQKQRTTKRR